MIGFYLQKARQRKLEFVDKLGRKWRWDRVRKKYVYVRKGKKKAAASADRNMKMIEAAKQGKTVSEIAAATKMSTAGVRRILKQAVSSGKLKQIASGKKKAAAKPSLKTAFDFDTRKKGRGTKEKVVATKEEQPYTDVGIKVGRAKITQKATFNYLPDDLKAVLRPHQADYVNLAMEQFDKGEKTASNFDGTGAGKTMQQIALAETYTEHHPNSKVLIVTENDRIIADAFAKDGKRLKVSMQPVKKAGDLKDTGPGVYITTYRDLQQLADSFDDISLSIFDEAHNMKNAAISAKAKVGIKLISKSTNTAMFTATPVDKAQHLAYLCQAYDLNFKKVMKFLGFKRKGNYYFTNLKYSEVAKRYDAMFKALTEKGLIVKREVPLDGMNMTIESVNLSDEYTSRYEAAVEKMEKQVQVAEGRRKGLIKAQWLMKIRALLEEAKLDRTVEKVEEALKQGKQAVLFASRVKGSMLKEAGKQHLVKFTEGTLTRLSEMFEKKGIRYAEVFGGKKEATADIKAFQNGKKQVLITTPQSGGTGISLDDVTGEKPRVAIVMTPPFSAVDFIQMPGRVHRLTTKSESEVIMMSTNTPVEEWNKNIIANKLVTLGASVKGDYAALNITDLEKVENMPPKEAAAYLKEQKKKATTVPTSSDFVFDIDAFKGAESLKKAMQLVVMIKDRERVNK